MESPSIRHQIDAIDTNWLDEVLRASNTLRSARVTNIRRRPIGNGLLGESTLLEVLYDSVENDAPSSLVVKLPSTHAGSRAACAAARLYLREVRFYQEIAPVVGILTPRTYFCAIDLDSHNYTLLMEDLRSTRPGNQIDGCSTLDCELAAREIAALHGPMWNADGLRDLPWLRGRELIIAKLANDLPAQTEGFVARYADRLNPELITVLQRFCPLYQRVVTDYSSPPTIIHGDFRLDNVLFDVRGETGNTATLDWQTTNVGPGVWDLAFFIGGALPRDVRLREEMDIVRLYHDALRCQGVESYTWDQCWRDYRRYALRSLFTTINAAMTVNQSDRSDMLFVKMITLHGSQILDLDSFSLWG